MEKQQTGQQRADGSAETQFNPGTQVGVVFFNPQTGFASIALDSKLVENGAINPLVFQNVLIRDLATSNIVILIGAAQQQQQKKKVLRASGPLPPHPSTRAKQ